MSSKRRWLLSHPPCFHPRIVFIEEEKWQPFMSRYQNIYLTQRRWRWRWKLKWSSLQLLVYIWMSLIVDSPCTLEHIHKKIHEEEFQLIIKENFEWGKGLRWCLENLELNGSRSQLLTLQTPSALLCHLRFEKRLELTVLNSSLQEAEEEYCGWITYHTSCLNQPW